MFLAQPVNDTKSKTVLRILDSLPLRLEKFESTCVPVKARFQDFLDASADNIVGHPLLKGVHVHTSRGWEDSYRVDPGHNTD